MVTDSGVTLPHFSVNKGFSINLLSETETHHLRCCQKSVSCAEMPFKYFCSVPRGHKPKSHFIQSIFLKRFIFFSGFRFYDPKIREPRQLSSSPRAFFQYCVVVIDHQKTLLFPSIHYQVTTT